MATYPRSYCVTLLTCFTRCIGIRDIVVLSTSGRCHKSCLLALEEGPRFAVIPRYQPTRTASARSDLFCMLRKSCGSGCAQRKQVVYSEISEQPEQS